ncbi:hypothetical protein DICVIV_10603 [Dictyocaulus viviparus]|uniref:Uncharacterized protein n=1 Tax=Dictyocaulus viviparus TaxID=29172 RepID=A0A0D8XI18_DICVI|nr:hypothetical protein DICVIV_10603 [Dictyocaulus viviparus]
MSRSYFVFLDLGSKEETVELALRAIISFKSNVHKQRVFAQKNSAAESSIRLSVLDTIPRDFIEMEEDLEMADEVDGEDDCAEEHDVLNEHVGLEPTVKSTEGEGTSSNHADESSVENNKDALNGAENGDEHPSSKHSRRKEYVDEDLEVPFEISWEGAPEFQWKLCHTPADSRRLIIENVFWADLQNVFIYRVMLKAETVDISFPMRYNIEGSKQMYGKLTMTFQWSMQIMNEAMRHLIYVRCPQGRRIKIFLPQTPTAVKIKEEFESKLGRVIQPTRRMHQLIVKVLPNDYELTLEAAKEMFAPLVPAEVENVKDDFDQPCAVVTMANVDDTIKAHSSISYVTVKREGEKDWKCHVFLRGVEAHFGSLITRWDRKKPDSSKKSGKRSGSDASKSATSTKKSRGNSGSGRKHGSRGRNSYSRGSYRGRGERVRSYGYNYGGGPPFDSPYMDSRTRAQHELELQERVLRHQEMLDSMAAKLREEERLAGYGYYPGRPSYGNTFNSVTQGLQFDY